jgi:hypothetical protein
LTHRNALFFGNGAHSGVKSWRLLTFALHVLQKSVLQKSVLQKSVLQKSVLQKSVLQTSALQKPVCKSPFPAWSGDFASCQLPKQARAEAHQPSSPQSITRLKKSSVKTAT